MLQREEVQIEMVQGTGVAGKGISKSFLFAKDWLDWWNDWQFADSEGLFMGVSWNSISKLGVSKQQWDVSLWWPPPRTSRWARSRLQDRESVERELLHSGCTHVMNAAGLTGRPNVDWCETHRQERCCC